VISRRLITVLLCALTLSALGAGCDGNKPSYCS
jgi:hypothetical protein